MSAGAFFSELAKDRTAETVAKIEAGTSAEIVVAVRNSSGHYRHSNYLFGFLCALGLLCALLFLPQPFSIDTWPLEMTLAFVIGAAFCGSVDPLRRLMTARKLMDGHVLQAARAQFYDLGVSATRDRTGILVYVSLFERRAEVVGDLGVAPAYEKASWTEAVEAMNLSIADGPDLDRFMKALAMLKAPLAKALPPREDDINELPDAMVTA